MSFLLSLLPYFLLTNITNCYSTGDLGKRDIAGIWRLKNDDSSSLSNFHIPAICKSKLKVYPLKEFTVYPKKNYEPHQQQNKKEVLLLLRENGEFSQYHDFVSSSSSLSTKEASPEVKAGDEKGKVSGIKGTWAFVDGNLILAADRKSTLEKTNDDNQKEHDTILTGRVVASSEERLLDNPALLRKDNSTIANGTSSVVVEDKEDGTLENLEDVHLSVPIGKVQIGKFFYPRKHPSFFEQPIFQPKSNGSFQLKQVLGSLNTRVDNNKLVEKFKKEDLMGKKYFITSFPSQYKRKRKQRWSIKYNKYVDKIPKTEQEKELEKREKSSPVPIKTFEVELFTNNTFSTITGLGDMVLRGKWWIIGESRDQLWMQVWRFGFGRSVSGSTFSEGSTLSQKDEVSYWGKIYKVDELEDDDNVDDNLSHKKRMQVEINGSVMSGCGLEPCSSGQFTMIEKTEEEIEYYSDGDEILEANIPELSDDIGSFE